MDSSAISSNKSNEFQCRHFNSGAACAFAGVIITTLGILLQGYTGIGAVGGMAMNFSGLAITLIGIALIVARKNPEPKIVKEQETTSRVAVQEPPSIDEEPETAAESLLAPLKNEKITQEKFNDFMRDYCACKEKTKQEDLLDKIRLALKADKTLLPPESPFDQSPLKNLTIKKAYEFVRLLFELDLDPNAYRNKSSFLHIFAKDDQCNDALKALVDTIDNASYEDSNGMTPLAVACSMNLDTKTISAPKNVQTLLRHAKAKNYSIQVREPEKGMIKGLTPFLRACQGPFSRQKDSHMPPNFTEAEKSLLPQLMVGIDDLNEELNRLIFIKNNEANAKVETFRQALIALTNPT